MKNLLLALFLFPSILFAQNQGENTPLGSGGSKIFCNSNAALTATVSGDGKLNFVACTTAGALITSSSIPASATSIAKNEDAVHASSDTGVYALSVYRSSVLQGAGTTGDYSSLITDIDGRLYVNSYGAAPSEWFSSCSSTITGTARTSVKAAVASNRNYITSVSCKNTSAVASGMDFTDGGGIILAVGNLTAQSVGGSWSSPFPTPLRGSVNTDFSVTMNTTGTSTICCANGFISTN